MNLPQKNWFEWAVFALSTLLVLVVLVYLGSLALTQTSAPPDVIVRPGAPVYGEASVRVPVEVVNNSSTAAQGVEVEVELGDAEGQQGSFVIDLLPPHATRQGWVVFTADPQTITRISARVVGYQEP